MTNSLDIKILNIDLIVGWTLDTDDNTCKICNGKLILPPENIKCDGNKIIKNDKILVGKCNHAYHQSCLNDFGDCCFEDSILFSTKKILDASLTKILH